LLIATDSGDLELELARRLETCGSDFVAFIDQQKWGLIGAGHPAAPQLYNQRRLRRDHHLEELVLAGQVDVVITSHLSALSQTVQSYFLQHCGNLAHLLAPRPFEAFTFSHEPLINELREHCRAVGHRYPELLAPEVEQARTYLSDIPRYSAELHARYRTWGIAPGILPLMKSIPLKKWERKNCSDWPGPRVLCR